MKRIIIFTLLVTLMLTSYCFAEKQEWFDKNYDFTKVKRVIVYIPNVAPEIENGISDNEIIDIFKQKTKLTRVTVIPFKEFAFKIQTDTGIDMINLFETNEKEFYRVIEENVSKYADIFICTYVSVYEMNSVYKEGYSYNTTNYQNSNVYGLRGGPVIIQTPVTQTNTIPGGNFPVAYVNVRIDVLDAKTRKPVLSRTDDRGKANITVFQNTKPKDIFERITESFFNDLSDKLK